MMVDYSRRIAKCNRPHRITAITVRLTQLSSLLLGEPLYRRHSIWMGEILFWYRFSGWRLHFIQGEILLREETLFRDTDWNTHSSIQSENAIVNIVFVILITLVANQTI